MAPRTFTFFALLLATTAIATPLTRGAPDVPAMAVREALDARDGNAGGAITAKDASAADDDEIIPDIVFVSWGENPLAARDGNADEAIAAKVRDQ
ncbi:hypothetical protein PG999_007600 [Apiospora kogelbergensis]|uniref:Uncharacterized protein n=1 Tax=Apiospora kogelbergensis TaxID=1337665 RepID=A0AAW0QQU2_9PEZI